MQNNLRTAKPLFSFVSKRYCFSLLDESHQDFYYSLYSNKIVMEKIAEPLGIKSLNGLFQHVLKHNKLGIINKSKSLNWVIQDLSTNEIVGIQGFIQQTNDAYEAEFGIMLSVINHQKGIANESISALIKFGFTEMGFNRLFANYTIQNKAIQRIAENLNFNISDGQSGSDSKHCWLTKQEFAIRSHLFERQ